MGTLCGRGLSPSFLVDVLAVAVRIRDVERWRSLGPEIAVRSARRVGLTHRARTARERERLQRAIGLVDRMFGANCYRRVLLDLVLDRQAAEEPVFFGLKSHAPDPPGHAWRGRDPDLERQFEAVFQVP